MLFSCNKIQLQLSNIHHFIGHLVHGDKGHPKSLHLTRFLEYVALVIFFERQHYLRLQRFVSRFCENCGSQESD